MKSLLYPKAWSEWNIKSHPIKNRSEICIQNINKTFSPVSSGILMVL